MGNIFTDLFSDQPAKDAAAAKKAGFDTANTNAGADLTAGQAGADALYGKAQGAYGDLATSTGRGSAAYGDASGANGPEGAARAAAVFRSLPGYSGGLDTGIDHVNRLAAAHGGFGDGNNSADVVKFASDYDANKYGSYVAGLAPYLGANSSAVAGQAGAYGQQAGADLGVAGQKASNDWSAATGKASADADADMAKYSASSNFWGTLLGGANLALKTTGWGGWAPGSKK